MTMTALLSNYSLGKPAKVTSCKPRVDLELESREIATMFATRKLEGISWEERAQCMARANECIGRARVRTDIERHL